MRDKIINFLFEISNESYRKLKNNKPWNLTKPDLLAFPKNSLGKQLGLFLDKNNFELLKKSERHDIYHILTGYDTNILDEIKLQFYLFGNGKKSIYLFWVLIAGTMLYPDKLYKFSIAYKNGKSALPFHNLPFLDLLRVDFDSIRHKYKIKLH
ncbi:Coq4 family protein [Aureibacter tunicatorum]|uniref:Ubiquinone biosynthesis protein Coq4 n=1 Tax=Aureibacter tunicatorum TaxID=866807 RepID=A0AAE4BVE9_9BACT|nr:Coq4 family protein [Aureibacter tunicatorum]MDR6241827.1 ubiquinone biosynthesis protein Coq4 [Aureibacter tunicatorum]BDD07074.1 hypothetical protein AUTU_45570 [Aureibacter tunicatorum]